MHGQHPGQQQMLLRFTIQLVSAKAVANKVRDLSGSKL